jgi:hypothetical protein
MLPAANAHFPPAILQFSSSRPKPRPSQGGASWKSMTLADLNALWPADLNATPWVARSSTVAPRVGGSATEKRPEKHGQGCAAGSVQSCRHVAGTHRAPRGRSRSAARGRGQNAAPAPAKPSKTQQSREGEDTFKAPCTDRHN